MIELQDIVTTKRELLSRETYSQRFSEEHKLRKSAERKVKSLQERLAFANQERFGDRRQKIHSKANNSDSDWKKEKDDY